MDYQLAQLNIAKMKYALDDPKMKVFVDALDPVNLSADSAPGFVWRLQGNGGDAREFEIYGDASYLVNMSVWESLDALRAFVMSPRHIAIMKQTSKWFEKMTEDYLVLWWVEAGHQPTVKEAENRLNTLRENGPTVDAFSFGKMFPPPS